LFHAVSGWHGYILDISIIEQIGSRSIVTRHQMAVRRVRGEVVGAWRGIGPLKEENADGRIVIGNVYENPDLMN
jgi:hypothetical protein